jgi:hypothetical protein
MSSRCPSEAGRRLGSARVSRAGFGVSPKQSFLAAFTGGKVRDGGTRSLRRLPDDTRALPGPPSYSLVSTICRPL